MHRTMISPACFSPATSSLNLPHTLRPSVALICETTDSQILCADSQLVHALWQHEVWPDSDYDLGSGSETNVGAHDAVSYASCGSISARELHCHRNRQDSSEVAKLHPIPQLFLPQSELSPLEFQTLQPGLQTSAQLRCV